MARLKANDEDVSVPGDDEIRILDEIAENCIPNRSEIITLFSSKLNRNVHISRDDVYKAAAVMASTTQVAALFGVDKNTIVKHFSREVDMARAFAKQKLITRFYHLAVYGNNPADRIFALKNWAGMSDQGLTESLEDIDEGVEFKVRRPTKPIENLKTEDTLEVVDNNEST